MSAFDGLREQWEQDTAERGVLPWALELLLVGAFFVFGLPAIVFTAWAVMS